MTIVNENGVFFDDSNVPGVSVLDEMDCAMDEFVTPSQVQSLLDWIANDYEPEEGEIFDEDATKRFRDAITQTDGPRKFDFFDYVQNLPGEVLDVLYCLTGKDIRAKPHVWRRGHALNKNYELAFYATHGPVAIEKDPVECLPTMRYVLEMFFCEVIDTPGVNYAVIDANWSKYMSGSECATKIGRLVLDNFDWVCSSMLWTDRTYARVNQLADLCVFPHRQPFLTTYMYEEGAERQRYRDILPGQSNYHFYWKAVLYGVINFMVINLEKYPAKPVETTFIRAGCTSFY